MNDSTSNARQSPFACVMSAIDADKREPHLANAKQLFKFVQEIRELENGFEFRFGNSPDLLSKLAEFVELERLCCPFLGFVIEVEPEGGEIWLRLTGREGVKPFIKAEIGELVEADWNKLQRRVCSG